MLSSIIDSFSNFEISKKLFYSLVLATVAAYFLIFSHELWLPDCIGYLHCFDVDRRERQLYGWSFQENFIDDFSIRYSISMLLLAASRDLLGSPRVATMLSSALFLVLVALVGRDITKSRFYGLVAMLLVGIDPIFLKYDNSITYPYFWVTAFMFAVYLSMRKSLLSLVPYFISIPLKMLNVLYFPVLVLIGDYTKRQRIACLGIVAGVIGSGFVLLYLVDDPIFTSTKGFVPYWFVYGLGMWAFDVKDDPVFLGSLFVSIFGLIILKKYNVPFSKNMVWCLLYFLVNPAIYSGFSTFTIEPYRFLAMISFVYISVGMFLKNLPVIVSDLKNFGKKPLPRPE